jgi:glc operon protein GlcG
MTNRGLEGSPAISPTEIHPMTRILPGPGRIRTWSAWVLFVLLGTAPLLAQDTTPAPPANPTGGAEVRDTAKMFGAEAVRRAQGILARLERRSHVPVIIETIESLDGEAIGEAGIRHAKRSGGHGVYILLAKDEKKMAGPLFRRELEDRLSPAKREAVREAFFAEFKKGDFDAGLLRGVESIAEALGGTAEAEAESGHGAAGSPLVARNQVRLTLAGARRVLAATEAKAAERGWKMNIAVVDDGGHLLAFARMDGARPASATTAMTKAITAATFRQATGPLPTGTQNPDILLNLSLQNAAAASGGKVTTLLGGIPIVVDGQVIGAVGVGGGSGEQDAEAAKAGVAAFLDDLKAPASPGRDGSPRFDTKEAPKQ